MTLKITFDGSGENVTPLTNMEPISKRTTSTDISLRYLEWGGVTARRCFFFTA